MTKKKPKVSVCIVTYNQDKYIDQCLQSILNQRLDFDFEVIIGDDCSIDGTREIIKKYEDKYPNTIKLILHKNNVGAIANIVSVYKQARGEYIAHLDGDDYASPDKLTKQVAALDKNKDCSICSHDIITVDKNSVELKRKKKFSSSEKKNRDYLISHLPFFAHSSKMFRNDSESMYYADLPSDTVDFELHLRHLNNNSVFHIAEFLGFYRVGVGIATSNNKINPALPAAIRRVFKELISENTSSYSKNKLYSIYSSFILRYATGSFMLGDLNNGKKYAEESLRIKLYSVKQMLIIIFFRSPKFVKLGFLKVYKFFA